MNSITKLLKRIATSAKTSVRTMSRIMTPVPSKMPSNCININALLMHLCDFDMPTYRYVLKWLAYPLQNPGAKMSTALMVNGERNTGMTMFFEQVIAEIYGRDGKTITSKAFNSACNIWASQARFVVINGAYSDTVSTHLKFWLTSETVQFNVRGVLPQRNRANFVFISHSEEFLPLDAGNRRFMILEAPPKREATFYAAVRAEIESGGVDAFLEHLLALNLDHFNQSTLSPTASHGRAITLECA